MKRHIYFIILFLTGSLISVNAQEKFTLSGYITDAKSGETLIGANLYFPALKSGTTTNTYGFYSITLEQGTYQAIVSYLGYETQFKQIELQKDIELTILLEPQSTTIGEVVISESKIKAKENVERPVMSVIDISPKLIKELPVLAGEKDLLKALQLLPGVQSGSEGTAGFYVRGGGPDQNLILLDDAVVYNPFHLAGFFSVFNVDAIKNVELIKGGYPAKFGGRLSSILDITMKEGDMKEFHGEGGIGLISSRLTLEGPIIKDKMSFLLSGRRTYADKVAQWAAPKDIKDEIPQLYFYDLNAKLNYKFSDRDRIYLSTYFGKDVFRVNIPYDSLEFKIPWGNTTSTLRWNHIFNKRLFANTSYEPEVITSPPDPRYVNDFALYASDEWSITENFSTNVGLRIPAFVYKKTNYIGFEPRFTFNVKLDKQSSLKGGYTLMNQYIHLVTNSSLSFPWDVWLPSSDIIKPKVAHQVALGYFRNFQDNTYESSVEVYYKHMDNLLEYKEGANIFFGGDKIEELLTFGKGWSYGAEFFFKKRTGRLNGWIGYTLSWSNRQFDDLNSGKAFPAKYDRRHDLSVVGTYEFNDKWAFTAALVYGSGHSITLPIGRYFVPIYNTEPRNNYEYHSEYVDRNGFKLNAYNRLDFGIRRTIKRKHFDSIFRFDIYNLYSRRNPYFVYSTSLQDPFSRGERNAAAQVSLLPMVPSASWNFKF